MKLYSKTLTENETGRDFVVADIHGCFELLEKALHAANFDPGKDRLFAIGDLIDRGPQSDQCLYYLSQPWFHAIRGNHEDIFCYIVTEEGGIDLTRRMTKIPDFMTWILDETPETRAEMRRAFLALPAIIEIEHAQGAKTGLVHADIPAGMTWDDFKNSIDAEDKDIYRISTWSHKRHDTRDDSGIAGIERVFFGHSPTAGPQKLGNCFFIDTGGVFRLMGESAQDFYISLIDIKASDTQILYPEKTAEDLVRLVKAGRPPELAPPPPPPSSGFNQT